MKNWLEMFFYNCLIFSVLICLSSNSWLSMWIGLEMNLLSIIPLMNNNSNSLSNEATLKYFLIQALASLLFLFFICVNFLKLNYFSIIFYNNLFLILMNSTLLMKLGAAPFHFWFPPVMNKMPWKINLILLTWQKINPMICISFCLMNKFIIFISIISIIMGSLGGMSSVSLKKILAFSSISHLGWMLNCMVLSENMFWFYFFFYLMINFSLIKLLTKMKINYLNQLSSNYISIKIKLMFSMLMLSMGGLPPFLGFIPKWLIINNMISLNMFWIILLMIMFTLMTLYFYLRMSFSLLIMNNINMYWIISFNNNFNNFWLYFSSMFIPLIFLFFN
nr:NADH dehydrogenase subunit 2 [Aviostivalius klossi bispiniformis]